MLEIELRNLIDKVDKSIEEKKSIKEGTISALNNLSKSNRVEFALFQSVLFKSIYKETLLQENDSLEIRVLSTLLTLFSMDGKFSIGEITSAKKVIRVIVRKTEFDEKWSTKKLFSFLQDDCVKSTFREDFKKIEKNEFNSKRLLPSLIKYVTAMSYIDGIEEDELKYLNDLERIYNEK